MKTGQLEIKKIGINGEGIGYIDKKICFVKGALPNELVEVEVTNQTRNFYNAKLVKIVERSQDRVASPCHSSKDCQGCSLLHMTPYLQQNYKKEAIRESIRKYTKYDLSKTVFKDVILPNKAEAYVTSVNYPVVKFKGRVSFGIYQRESKFLTILTSCYKQHPTINTVLKEIEEILNQNKVKLYSDKFKTGLRFLKAKYVDGKVQIVFITGKDKLNQEIIDQVSKIKDVKGIFISVNTTKHQEFDEVGYSKLYGSTRLEYRYNEQNYLVTVKSDLGENNFMTKRKVKEISKLIEGSVHVLSLNCGVGLVECSNPQQFTSYDEKSYHIEDAKLNGKYLHKENAVFKKGDLDEKIVLEAKKKIHDTFLIQNGRFGLSDVMKESIKLSRVRNVVITCDSHSTLAKDLGDLQDMYKLEKIVALDSYIYASYATILVKLVRK